MMVGRCVIVSVTLWSLVIYDALFGHDGGTLCYQCHTMVSRHLRRRCRVMLCLAMMVGRCVTSVTLWSLVIYEEGAE